MNRGEIALNMKIPFSDPDNWEEIEKQSIFEAWVPFVAQRELQFYIPNPEKENHGIITGIIDDSSHDSEHFIVSKMKRRKVIVLTKDELCQDVMFPDVLVAKIISIKDKTSRPYKLMVENKHPFFIHLPEHITGEESYINMAQVTTIGKTLLIQKQSMLPRDQMAIVEEMYAKCVDLGIIKEDSSDDIAVNE